MATMSQPRNALKRSRVNARRQRHATKRRDLRKQRASGRTTRTDGQQRREWTPAHNVIAPVWSLWRDGRERQRQKIG